MTNYTVGQRIKITFENDFHNTSAVGIAQIVKISDDEIFLEIGYSAAKQIERKLCGMGDCTCGALSRGHHKVQATGQTVCIFDTANRNGKSINGEAPRNPLRLIMNNL